MKKVQFSVEINAPKEKVWNILWADATYRKWTSVFSEGSYAVSDWKEGSRVHFLNANNEGMYSVIDQCIENKIMNFKHIGNIKHGVEMPLDATTENWSGATENYTLSEKNGIITLTVDTDIVGEYQDYFNEKFPLALDLIKKLAEL